MTRATMSGPLPAGKPTIKCTGRAGYACALANRDTPGRAAAPATRRRNRRRGSFTSSSRSAAPAVEDSISKFGASLANSLTKGKSQGVLPARARSACFRSRLLRRAPVMESLPLGSDFCRGWGWNYQLFLRGCHHLRGSSTRTGQVSYRGGTGPADDCYFHPAFRRGGDVIIEAVQHARQHTPERPSVGSADGLIERN